jgi:hypothetical protein
VARQRGDDAEAAQRGRRDPEFSLGLAAAVAGAAAAYVSGSTDGEAPAAATAVAAWVAVLTTLAGAIAAPIGAGRYEFLVMSYYATARRLDELVEGWRADGAPTDSPRWSAFVQACEAAISVENESWLARHRGAARRGTRRRHAPADQSLARA